MPLGSSSSTSGEGYEPDPVTVSPGAIVVWDNEDNALHTATSGNPDTKLQMVNLIQVMLLLLRQANQ